MLHFVVGRFWLKTNAKVNMHSNFIFRFVFTLGLFSISRVSFLSLKRVNFALRNFMSQIKYTRALLFQFVLLRRENMLLSLLACLVMTTLFCF